MKVKEKKDARRLRKEEGMAVGKIADKLGVSKSSVSLWVRDIELTDKQKTILVANNPIYNAQLRGSDRNKDSSRARREGWMAEGEDLLESQDPLLVVGCMLYWAEGSKGQNSVVFVNSDAQMIKLFAKFLIEGMGVKEDNILVSVNCFTDIHSLEEIEAYWLSILELSKTNIRKATVNYHSSYSHKKRSGKLPFGTCRLAVHSTEILQKMYGGIEKLKYSLTHPWCNG